MPAGSCARCTRCLVGVEDDAGNSAAPDGHRHGQRSVGQRRVMMGAEREPDDPARAHVQHRIEVELALAGERCRPVQERAGAAVAGRGRGVIAFGAGGQDALDGPVGRVPGGGRFRARGLEPGRVVPVGHGDHALGGALHAYIVVSLLTGARTEELRPLTWSHVDLDADPPHIMVWRSVRAGGETKTKKSRRTLKLSQRCVDVLRDHREEQEAIRKQAGDKWQDNDLVFPSRVGTSADASHVRCAFRKVTGAAGLNPADWSPRELRHSFVSLLSDAGVPIEQISRLVGHSGTTTTETIYRKQIRPVITGGAEVMDRLFPRDSPDAEPEAPDA
jgi:integrase-like protein